MRQNSAQGQCGFSIIELLVVVAILSILMALLWPVLATGRDKARQTQCLSNQRQLAQAVLLYTGDYDETLPFFGDRHPQTRVFWNTLVQPYLRNRQMQKCPSWPHAGKYYNAMGRLVGGQHGIGVNYGTLFRYAALGAQIRRDPLRLGQVAQPSRVLMLTDGQGRLHVYSPAVWALTVDWDHDRQPDSHAGILASEGPYNRGDPFRHSGGANCAFLDGHARWIDGRSWLRNRDDLWGTELPTR